MNIKETILKAMQESGYTKLRPIQEKVIPLLEQGDNVCVQAETGAGKTAAYLIPCLQEADPEDKNPQTLVLAPTRELALQIGREADKLSVYARLHCVTCIGGEEIRRQENALRNKAHIVIGTPGRLLDLITQGSLVLTSLKTVVLDEADQILSTGQIEETSAILKQCHARIALFSATLTDSLKPFLPETYTEVVCDKAEVNHKIETYHIMTGYRKKTLNELLKHLPITSAIVFVTHKNDATEIANLLKDRGIRAAAFSSGFDQRTREHILKDFRTGKTRILVATDAAARGLDLPDVSHIIHYELPIDKETYIHRSGRTAHNRDSGITITLLTEADLETDLGKEIHDETTPYEVDRTVKSDIRKVIKKEKERKPSVTTLLIRAGRDDKLRPKDIIGALCEKIPFEEIGKLEIQDRFSTVTILKDAPNLARELNGLKIKGKPRKIEKSFKEQ